MKSSNRQSPFSRALDFNWFNEFKDVAADLADLVARTNFSGSGEFAGKAANVLDTALSAITQRIPAETMPG